VLSACGADACYFLRSYAHESLFSPMLTFLVPLYFHRFVTPYGLSSGGLYESLKICYCILFIFLAQCLFLFLIALFSLVLIMSLLDLLSGSPLFAYFILSLLTLYFPYVL